MMGRNQSQQAIYYQRPELSFEWVWAWTCLTRCLVKSKEHAIQIWFGFSTWRRWGWRDGLGARWRGRSVGYNRGRLRLLLLREIVVDDMLRGRRDDRRGRVRRRVVRGRRRAERGLGCCSGWAAWRPADDRRRAGARGRRRCRLCS